MELYLSGPNQDFRVFEQVAEDFIIEVNKEQRTPVTPKELRGLYADFRSHHEVVEDEGGYGFETFEKVFERVYEVDEE